MINNKKITLILPCKNEANALPKLLSKMPASIDEIIVIDNNSTDNTQQVAKQYNAKVICENRHHNGSGYGYAHLTGMKKAKGDYIVAMDGDNTYPVDKIIEIITLMDSNHIDFVSCSRLPLVYPNSISKLRIAGIKILNSLVKILYKYEISDILSGMWILNRNALKKLKIVEKGWNLSAEIKLDAFTNPEIKFIEVSIPYLQRHDDISKLNEFKNGFDYFIYLIKRRYFYKVKTKNNHSSALPKRLLYSLKNISILMAFKKFLIK